MYNKLYILKMHLTSAKARNGVSQGLVNRAEWKDEALWIEQKKSLVQ